jgi:hypothetical protein
MTKLVWEMCCNIHHNRDPALWDFHLFGPQNIFGWTGVPQ